MSMKKLNIANMFCIPMNDKMLHYHVYTWDKLGKWILVPTLDNYNFNSLTP